MPALDTSTTTDVPALLPVGIAGHSYQMDVRGYRRQSVQMLRQQADTTDLPSEQSLNPQGPWRRSQESWHHGAGQVFFDGKTSGQPSDPERYYTSAGVDIWTRGQVSLLNTTVKVYTEVANVNQPLLGVGYYLYVADYQTLYWSNDPTTTSPTWTSSVIQAGQAARPVLSITTNGSYVWAALDTSGIHRTAAGDVASTADVPAGTFEMVSYVMGRLLASNGPTLYEITSPISAPAATTISGHADPFFSWAGAAPGRNCIYAWGNTLDTFSTSYGVGIGTGGEVYRISVVPTTGALGAPTPATYLPDGETVNQVQFYAGGVILCTNKGVRLGIADAQGNIDYGPLVAGGSTPVLALEPQDRYVWVSGQAQGLTRIDLGYLTDSLTPAYAPDLAIDPGNAAVGIAWSACNITPGLGPCFTWYSGSGAATNGHGVYRKTANKVSSGTLETGQIRFGTTASKTLRRLEIRHLPLPAGSSILCELKRDGGSYTTIGTSNTTSATQASFDIGSLSAETAELRFTLSRATDNTTGPTLTRWTLTALPTPRRDEQFTLPLMLRESVENLQGEGKGIDVAAELSYLKTLWSDGTVFTLQIGGENLSAQIQDYRFEGESLTARYADTNGYGSGRSVQGTLTLLVQTVG